MSLKACLDCGALYAPAGQCPQCQATVYAWEWEVDMPKTTVTGGASNGPPETPAEPAVKAAPKAKPARAKEPVKAADAEADDTTE